jgi:hypothetical protein
MTLEWAIEEIKIRRKEDKQAEEDGSWEAFAQMKRTRSFRRKAIGYSRTKAKAWMEVAEWELSKRNTIGNGTP